MGGLFMFRFLQSTVIYDSLYKNCTFLEIKEISIVTSLQYCKCISYDLNI